MDILFHHCRRARACVKNTLPRERERERKKYARAHLKKTHQGNHEMSVERIASRVFRIKTIKRQHAVQILRRVPR